MHAEAQEIYRGDRERVGTAQALASRLGIEPSRGYKVKS